MIALFWDIDGTLLTTSRAGVFALEAALEEVTDRRVSLREIASSGLTDHEVALAVFAIAEVEAEEGLVDRYLRAYERHLPDCLPLRKGHVMPGVREVLHDLHEHNLARSFVLTGNTPAGARAKLDYYGLLEFFDNGAYCIGPEAREEIAHRAAILAPAATQTYVIGDTPRDISCGKAIGAFTVAVATGAHSRDRLAEQKPWRVLDRIPDPADFRRLIGVT